MKDEITGYLAALRVFEQIASQFSRACEKIANIAEDEIVIALEKSEDFLAARDEMPGEPAKITEAIHAFLAEKQDVDEAFSAALIYLQSKAREATGVAELDFSGEAEDIL